MKKTTTLADRAADASLALIAAFNLLFFASFVLITLMVTGKAHAAAPVCTGTDIVEQLETSDPELLAEIRAEAARTRNGKGLLWKVERDGADPSWLFGTMHLTDPRVLDMPAAARSALDGSDTVVIETTDVLDPAAASQALLKRPDLMMFTDGTTLSSRLEPDDEKILKSGLTDRGIPLESVDRMKPWMLAALVALPACELARKNGGAAFLDIKLAKDAEAQGKTLAGLETMTDQLSAMASLPIEMHMAGLVGTLQMADRIDDVTETMITLYINGEIGMIWPLFHKVMPGSEEYDYASFEETMVTARNRTMAERAVPMLDAGNAFIAVGALHLPGEEGLVELLRKAGYKVTAVN